MAEFDSLKGLEALHRDLEAIIDLKLPVVDRLLQNLETHLEDFRALLDKKPRNDDSRNTLTAGKITIGGDVYEVNDEFKQHTLELAGALDLDEVEAAALFFSASDEAQELDRSQSQAAVIRFHRRREYVVLCLRLLTKIALDNGEVEVEGIQSLQLAVELVTNIVGNNFDGAHRFWAKCLSSMDTIEKWLQSIGERLQSAQVVGQTPLPDFVETMTFQLQSLTRQHENLAAICTYMVKPGFANLANFNALLAKVRTIDRHDMITIHYVPMIMRSISWICVESNCTTQEARDLHSKLMAGRESDNWTLRNFHAATITWWLAEYSGRYVDPNPDEPELRNVNFSEEALARSTAFFKALDDGAFQFMLSVSQDVRPTPWYDPTKTSMISLLLQDTAVLIPESTQIEEYFKILVMEQMQTFVDSFITNMPDTLRRLKVEEDDQRRRLQLHFQRTGEQPFHLERFLVIVSYAFDGFEDASDDFWNDKESNLYGFLQWAAKRQPTPRIAMFCEMLRAISTGDSNADSAHKFLLEEGASSSGKIRRTSSLSYTHIFNELIEFQTNIHEPKKTIQGGVYPPSQNPVDQIVEPESATMLESYLRLIAHLCRQSPTARRWLLDSQEYNLAGICFALCNDKVETGLRAAAFNTVAALLVEKDALRASGVWNLLDDWTVSGFYVGTKQTTAMSPFPRDEFWATLADGYDESLAFIRLLQVLVQPYSDDEGLNDTLPFPESLSSTRRMPGIEKYIDFAMHQVFAERCPEVQDTLQRNVMRWTCLRLIATCLSTFNENLVVFANKTSIPVDSVIDPSSLVAYVTLHPFTRVIEWLFNDKVLKSLFAASHHSVDEVDAAASDSPLVQSLMLSIEVMDLVMRLQATYLDIVRPVIKQQASIQHTAVSNLSLASFEDAILNNLQIIVDLGLYCGTGHEALTIASLQLLEKLASSRKLAVSPAGFGQRSGRSKIVGILEKDNEAERIGRSLFNLMQSSEEELDAGPEAPGYVVKLKILDFINSCITAVSLRPTIAHVLLGFSCGSTTVRITEDGLWQHQRSLFHSILVLAHTYPDWDGTTFISWRSTIKTRCWDILQRLWKSPLTSAIVMDELRHNELLFQHAPDLMLINPDTLWDGISLSQAIEEQATMEWSEFFSKSPGTALQNFLQQRAAYLDYTSRELRLTVREGMPTMRSRIQSMLLGSTIRPGEDPVPNHDIFALFDFIQLQWSERPLPDQHKLLEGVNLSICQEEKDGIIVYALPLVEQLLLLRMKSWRKDNTFKDEAEKTQMADEAQLVLNIFEDWNRREQLTRYHKDILRSWVQLLTVTLESCEFDVSTRTSFIFQTLQVILPKLDASYNDDIFTALQLASLAEALIQKVDFDSTAFEKTRKGDFANDRLSQLFRAALVGVYSPVSTVELREYCYQICFRYIQGTFNKATKGSALGRHTLHTVKNCGGHLLEVICDDAYSGQGTCKVSSLLLLSALETVAIRQESKYVLETFVSLNFVGVLVDNIKHIPEELKAAAAPQVSMLLSYYDATLALLLRICQTRPGAAYVLNAGLFPAIRESRIFDVDPDIGLEFDNANALKKYYELMLAVLRVINAAVIARGRQNDQTVFQAREFLKLNRHSMVAIFKRSVNVGAGQDIGAQQDLLDLVDCYTVLVDITGFLQYEDSSSTKKARANMFS
ncbi:nucleoporin Nup186/Nup192/Nup205 [Massariosphaeria phaeospora]|uniref:Nucleoporin Nup186/Nup192/Nup205 n=1 Tax=Massariosphaeria phaeospora TaxID=100035 RepID=A0A7C8I7W0_9PLEO|nr:nucleoporin Nup186/Nup192/Nup205 [Massariosphaeria phaeospora]